MQQCSTVSRKCQALAVHVLISAELQSSLIQNEYSNITKTRVLVPVYLLWGKNDFMISLWYILFIYHLSKIQGLKTPQLKNSKVSFAWKIWQRAEWVTLSSLASISKLCSISGWGKGDKSQKITAWTHKWSFGTLISTNPKPSNKNNRSGEKQRFCRLLYGPTALSLSDLTALNGWLHRETGTISSKWAPLTINSTDLFASCAAFWHCRSTIILITMLHRHDGYYSVWLLLFPHIMFLLGF